MKLKAGMGLALLALVACSPVQPDCGQLPAAEAIGNAGCLIKRDDAVVLVQQRVSGLWALPGGTAESGERAACTAARETREETGLQVQVREHLETLDNGFHLFRCDVVGEERLQPADALEISQAAWKTAADRTQLEWRFPQFQPQVERLMEVAQ